MPRHQNSGTPTFLFLVFLEVYAIILLPGLLLKSVTMVAHCSHHTCDDSHCKHLGLFIFCWFSLWLKPTTWGTSYSSPPFPSSSSFSLAPIIALFDVTPGRFPPPCGRYLHLGKTSSNLFLIVSASQLYSNLFPLHLSYFHLSPQEHLFQNCFHFLLLQGWIETYVVHAPNPHLLCCSLLCQFRIHFHHHVLHLLGGVHGLALRGLLPHLANDFCQNP